jgi:hypothetical protein
LDQISSYLPARGENSEILYKLAKSPSTMVRKSVAWNDAMDEKTAERLIRDASIDVLRAIVQNSDS